MQFLSEIFLSSFTCQSIFVISSSMLCSVFFCPNLFDLPDLNMKNFRSADEILRRGCWRSRILHECTVYKETHGNFVISWNWKYTKYYFVKMYYFPFYMILLCATFSTTSSISCFVRVSSSSPDSAKKKFQNHPLQKHKFLVFFIIITGVFYGDSGTMPIGVH